MNTVERVAITVGAAWILAVGAVTAYLTAHRKTYFPYVPARRYRAFDWTAWTAWTIGLTVAAAAVIVVVAVWLAPKAEETQ